MSATKMTDERRKMLAGDLRMLVAAEDRQGRGGLDSTMVANRILRESLAALELLEGRLDAVRQTLNEHGAPTEDERGARLNVNGRLVDWIAGRRVPGWRLGTGRHWAESDVRALLVRLYNRSDSEAAENTARWELRG